MTGLHGHGENHGYTRADLTIMEGHTKRRMILFTEDHVAIFGQEPTIRAPERKAKVQSIAVDEALGVITWTQTAHIDATGTRQAWLERVYPWSHISEVQLLTADCADIWARKRS